MVNGSSGDIYGIPAAKPRSYFTISDSSNYFVSMCKKKSRWNPDFLAREYLVKDFSQMIFFNVTVPRSQRSDEICRGTKCRGPTVTKSPAPKSDSPARD